MEAPDLFVCFDDSSNNPPYRLADYCSVVSVVRNGEENPCHIKGAISARLIPTNLEELLALAEVLGLEVTFDENGQALLNTRIYDPRLREVDV